MDGPCVKLVLARQSPLWVQELTMADQGMAVSYRAISGHVA